MLVLGIDPGLETTGYGIIENKDRKFNLIEAGIFTTKKTSALGDRLKSINDELEQLLREFNVDVVVLEKLYAHYRHPITAYILGHVRGIICLSAANKGIKLIECLPTRAKKAVTGNGHASKEQVQRMVLNLLGLKILPKKFDITDALALAISYFFISKPNL